MEETGTRTCGFSFFICFSAMHLASLLANEEARIYALGFAAMLSAKNWRVLFLLRFLFQSACRIEQAERHQS